MDTRVIFNFLKDLSANNSFDWMKANKNMYDQAKLECEMLVQELINKINLFDNSVKDLIPKNLIWMLNRDARFSNDKSPYNPSFRAHISIAGRNPIPAGYYLNIKPNNIFLGGGLFASQFPEATKLVRDYIVQNEKGFTKIIEERTFAENFEIVGEKLKNVPKEYEKEHKYAEYLKHKSWDIEYHVQDKIFLDANKFIELSVEMFKYMKPFNDYLNKALKDFKIPERK
ncbi:MAG: DUF2461 domain-containing protein [Helicobacteraceae bacterium]|jgi:uncharacterized protein (TIGR02453 family)|nr:DUF2461 domain-containing protein [Helicobacteraceae bacterium]